MTSRRDRRRRGHGGPSPGRAGLLVRLWRWRTETVLFAATSSLLVTVVLSLGEGDRWPFLVLAATAGVLSASGFWRRWVTAHAWCLLSRHRIRRVCEETGTHTRSGRLPLILWITPSAAGEKALVLARAGTCAEDFDAFSAEIAAACCARDAVVARHGRWANLLTVEIVRRDGAAGPPVGLERLYGLTGWVSPRTGRSAGEPGTHLATVPPPEPGGPVPPDDLPGAGEVEPVPPDDRLGAGEVPGRRRAA